jgi:hypothetical protein
MDKSTPLSHLRRNEEQQPQDANVMMDNIVNDLEGGYDNGEYDDQQHPQQQMPPQGPPQGRYPMPMPQLHQQQPTQPHPGVIYPPRMMQQPQQMPQQQNFHGGDAGLENVSFTQKLLHDCKEPLLVAVLVVMMSSGQVVSLINRFLPMAQGNPLIGFAVRAIMAGIAFYLLRRFIPS